MGQEEETEPAVRLVADFRGRERRRPVRAHEWTEAKRSIFLERLAAEGCVRTAAGEAGMPERSAYALRQRDPQFSDAWADAIRCHYHALEALLLRKARGEAVPELEAIDVELSLILLKLHQAALAKGPRGGGPRPRTASKAELIEALRKQLGAVKRRQGRRQP